MNSNSQQHSGSARSWLLALVLVIGFGAFVIYAKVDVDRRMMRSGGVWAIEPSTLPPWFPPQFSNQLGELHRVPSRVSLHSVRWKEGVIGELSAIPWIESVQRVERTARGIGFEGQLVRPSVGIRIDDGWLLVDGIGNVLATQPGDFLFPEWKMPEYMPGAAGSTQPVAIDCAVGDRLGGSEYVELLGLLGVLWQDNIFDRVPGFLHEISHTVDGSGQRMWHLHTSIGILLHWGRSPSSEAAQVASSQQKLNCLKHVLESRNQLATVGGIQGILLFRGEEGTVVKSD